ncbi:MAG: hypothetical protein U0Q18_06860 [Bryobacteraceae bacterium]
MKRSIATLSIPALLVLGGVAAPAEDARGLWEQVVQAKGGHERLHGIKTLAVYMKPVRQVLFTPAATWFFVFPDRYFEYDGPGSGEYPYASAKGVGLAPSPRCLVVNGSTDRIAMDATGIPHTVWTLTPIERDRLTLNQLVYLLESAWLQPIPVSSRGRALTVEAGGRTFELSLNGSHLPERIVSAALPGEKSKNIYDYRLLHYREVDGIALPARVIWTVNRQAQWTWDVDYEINGRYNPKFFEHMPDLALGPEPWRRP